MQKEGPGLEKATVVEGKVQSTKGDKLRFRSTTTGILWLLMM